jgi:6-phosphogluconate dehydrogenase
MEAEKMKIGIIGLAVMGSNLALNMADHGFKVAGYNYTPDLTDKFAAEHPHENIQVFYDLKTFLNSLQKPRKVMLMIMAGKPVDQMLEQLIPLLDKGDVVLDGGNSFFKDTIRRHALLAKQGLNYFGVGVSGGESGARHGPAIMPGGPAEVYPEVKPVLEAIAAKAGPEQKEPCCSYIGPDGAGHYVKMVHNGIEYADMELIAEAYLLLKHVGGLSNRQMAEIFRSWNEGELHSYLIGITAEVLVEGDEEGGGELVDKILDSAEQKGTGRWTSIQALEQGVDVSMITAACNARVMSNLGTDRTRASQVITGPALKIAPEADLVEKIRQSLYVAKIIAYAQGFSLYRSASELYSWKLDLGKIAGIFRGGCIIQARFLDKITEAYTRNPALKNLLLDEFFLQKINQDQGSLRQLISHAALLGLPVPAFASALQYLDSYRSTHVGANLIQAQRDYFGAHTYQRTDKPGIFHHQWPQAAK